MSLKINLDSETQTLAFLLERTIDFFGRDSGAADLIREKIAASPLGDQALISLDKVVAMHEELYERTLAKDPNWVEPSDEELSEITGKAILNMTKDLVQERPVAEHVVPDPTGKGPHMTMIRGKDDKCGCCVPGSWSDADIKVFCDANKPANTPKGWVPQPSKELSLCPNPDRPGYRHVFCMIEDAGTAPVVH